MSNKSPDSIISLPKGGGAQKGIGATFSPNLFTGTGNFSVPIALPPGRNGFQPEITLAYSTGSGSSPFGLGWSSSIPGVTRKTSRGIPRYRDYAPELKDRDTFVLSGAEDLVPVDGAPQGATRYRPRTEGLFARIDHYHTGGNNYWQVQSKDGLISFYGTPRPADAPAEWQDPAIVADPEDRTKIFAWKLTRTQDLFGNHIIYEYDRDIGEDGPHRWDEPYLSEIKYADYTTPNGETAYLVSATFNYEDRPDPSSDYRAGFEMRTRKRCTHISVKTRAGEDRLVRTTRFIYLDQRVAEAQIKFDELESALEADPTNDDLLAQRDTAKTEFEHLQSCLPLNGSSLLSQVKVVGHDGDQTEELPPLEFGYSKFELDKRDFFPMTGRGLPAQSLGAPDIEMVDLFSNGLPDILQMNGTVRYWRNLGNGEFALPRQMQEVPLGVSLADANVQMIDADGDGRIDLMATDNGLPGYYSMKFNPDEPTWDRRSFQRQKVAPSFNLADPEVKLIDLDGDGVTDCIRSGSRLECFFNDPKEGWNETRFVERRALEEFPNVNFSDPRVQLSDMCGDGLTDVVMIHDGNVEYWPNLGYGDWGKRVSMRNSPRFPYGYDPRRILLGDVDGDGLVDMIYVDHCEVTLWINQNGNGWSDPITIDGTPDTTDMDAVRMADMLGTGLGGILWSRDASLPGKETLLFLDLTGGHKPYLLDEMNNHMGAITRVKYEASTRFYLEDQKNPETRWQTPLPMPVLVVSHTEVIDEISGGKLTTEYSYHHGYWDGAEREFRGFGRVDQRDTEVFDDYHAPGLHPDKTFETIEPTMFSPPLETRSWFHLGPVGNEFGDWQEPDYSHEYWQGDPQVLERPDAMTDFLKSLPRRAKRDALRTLRSSSLRTELYALDGSERQNRPYTVTESIAGFREEAGPGNADKRIFFSFGLAQRTTQWERGDDPMTQFSFTENYDEYGQPLQQFSIAVPRGRDYREALPAASESEPYLATASETELLNRDDETHYLIGRALNGKAWEIINDGRQSVFELAEAIRNGTAERNILSQAITYYDGPAFEGLPYGQIGDYGVPVRGETLVLTEEILHEAYKSGDTVLDPPEAPPYLVPGAAPDWSAEYPQSFRDKTPELAGYIFRDGGPGSPFVRGYFVPGERQKFDFQDAAPETSGRGLVLQTRDPLDNETTITYDDYDFLPLQVTDPLGLTVTSEIDYRLFQPRLVTDENGNRSAAIFSPLGMVTASLVMGKLEEDLGDTFEVPGSRMEYDFFAFLDRKEPIYVRSIVREHHVKDTHIPLPERDDTIISVEYSDGFGRSLQTRTQAEEVIFGETPFGGDVGLPSEQAQAGQAAVGRTLAAGDAQRVIVSGLQIYNNKGLVVEQYEPFYSAGFDYIEPEDEEKGQKVQMFYDPRGQVILTLDPDGSEQRVIYGKPLALSDPELFFPTPWEACTYDANDNAGRTHSVAAAAYAHHWNTPASIVTDALGRTIEAVERNGQDPVDWFITRSTYDIRGNLLTVTDALGWLAFQHVYNLIPPEEDEESGEKQDSPVLRIDSIDAGLRRIVFDAFGNEIERHDSKGAMIIQTQDGFLRPLEIWARDDAETELTLRQKLVYADATDSGLTAEQARAANMQAQLYKHYDEAGCLTAEQMDFRGNLLEKTRQVIADAAILSAFDNPPPDWKIDAFRVDWQPPTGTNFADHAATLLETQEYRTSSTYDALGRPEKMLYPEDVDGQRKTLHPQYNRAGNLERVLMFPSPSSQGEGQGGVVYVERIAYDAKGQRILLAYGNGVMTRYAYDPLTFRLLRLRSERYSKPDALTYQPDGNVLQDYGYTYDLAGNILTITDRVQNSGIPNNPQAALEANDPVLAALVAAGNALKRRFTYDPTYRLLRATGRECDKPLTEAPWKMPDRCTDITRTRGYAESYTYDAMGNCQQLGHGQNGNGFTRDFTQETSNNRLQSMQVGEDLTYTYKYDTNGNMKREGTTRHFEWNHSDQMKVFRNQINGSEPSLFAFYLYDAGGMRVKKLVRKQGGTLTTTTYIDEAFEQHTLQKAGETTRTNNTLHVMDSLSRDGGNSQRIALVRVGNPFPNDNSPTIQYQLSDHLGSSSLVLDNSGAWTNREELTPYGETSFGGFHSKRYRYTGKERDEESGLSYHGARYYAAWIVMWLSSDPIGMEDSVNLYLYAANTPIMMLDRTGEDPVAGALPTPRGRSLMTELWRYRRLAPRQFVQFLNDNKSKLYPFLKQFGYKGCWVKVNDHLADFDAAAKTFFPPGRLPFIASPAPDPDEQILAELPDGTGFIGTRRQYNWYAKKVQVERILKTLTNIGGSVSGAVGSGIGGDKGSDMGAAISGMTGGLARPSGPPKVRQNSPTLRRNTQKFGASDVSGVGAIPISQSLMRKAFDAMKIIGHPTYKPGATERGTIYNIRTGAEPRGLTTDYRLMPGGVNGSKRRVNTTLHPKELPVGRSNNDFVHADGSVIGGASSSTKAHRRRLGHTTQDP